MIGVPAVNCWPCSKSYQAFAAGQWCMVHESLGICCLGYFFSIPLSIIEEQAYLLALTSTILYTCNFGFQSRLVLLSQAPSLGDINKEGAPGSLASGREKQATKCRSAVVVNEQNPYTCGEILKPVDNREQSMNGPHREWDNNNELIMMA
jgi:hypothetical protein